MDMMDRINEKIRELTPEYTRLWAEICMIESPTVYKAGVDAVCRRLTEYAEAKGWQTEICPQEVSGDVACITLHPGAPGAPIALSGHMDTVHPVGSFGTPAVRMDETKIYGPGVQDCKGGIIAAMLAMDALEQCGFDARPVMLLLQSDEEKGSMPSRQATINWICEKAKGAAAFLNGEGRGIGKALISCKGILRFEFRVHGVGGHSSQCYKLSNAILDATYRIQELEKQKNPDGITCNCGTISGGTVPNAVAEECVFTADFRFPQYTDMEVIRETVRRVAEAEHLSRCRCEAVEISHRPPMERVQRNLDLLAHINEILAARGMQTLEPTRANGGTDAAYVTLAGIPCLDSFGVIGGSIHTVNEFALLDSLPSTAELISTVIAGF